MRRPSRRAIRRGSTGRPDRGPGREAERTRQAPVELVVNGKVAASKELPADGQAHEIQFEIQIGRSSWVALRQFPQLHTNPVDVLVDGKPIRASKASALWCLETIEQLWRARSPQIAEAERAEARRTFDEASQTFRRIAAEAPRDSFSP